jgi:hypothetical protein
MILDDFLTLMLLTQKICLLCLRPFSAASHCVLVLKDQVREIKDVVSMRFFLILLLDAHSSQARQMIRTSRLTSLSFGRQAKYCLNISDRCLRYHESFIFVALNMLQRRQAHLQTHFAVRKSNFDSDDRKLTNVSPDVLRRLASRLEQGCKLSNLDMDEWNALKLLHQVNTMSTRS